ncbi:hypothetical protein D3C86_1452580 [compost metagenome]
MDRRAQLVTNIRQEMIFLFAQFFQCIDRQHIVCNVNGNSGDFGNLTFHINNRAVG